MPAGAEHGVRNTGAGELRVFYVLATGSFDDVHYEFSAAAPSPRLDSALADGASGPGEDLGHRCAPMTDELAAASTSGPSTSASEA